MQFEALKVFCDVARCRSFSQAAAVQRPQMTQSAVSQIVRLLEERVGVQLIDRARRPLQLTAPGKLYYEGCKRLIEQFDELEALIKQQQAQIDTTIQVAAIYSVGLGDMGQLVERFEAEQQGTRVHIEYLHPDQVYQRVLERSADLGLVSFPRRSRELLVVPWREEPMVLACAPGHALATMRTIKPAQLNGEKYVGFDKGLVVRREVDRFLREQGVSVEIVMEFDNIENIKKAVEIGAGVALLPEPTLRREVQAGTLAAIPLAAAQLVRPLGIIYSRYHRLNTTILRFIDLLRDGESSATSGLRHDARPDSPSDNGQPNGLPQSPQPSSTPRRRPRATRGIQGNA
jgi:DNA-binding transcriptional LysR family regulator